MFKLHPILEKDTIVIKDLKLCRLLLMNNAFYPWVILVPKKADLTEIFDLEQKDQNLLMKEISLVSKAMEKLFKADKMNIAALGNMVSQLHIHIIARYKNDRTFPKPIWVDNESKNYEEDKIGEIIRRITASF